MRQPLAKRPVGVVGLDLSLSRPAAVWLSADWDPARPWMKGLIHWTAIDVGNAEFGSRLASAKLAGPHVFAARRLAEISERLLEFVRSASGRAPALVACEDHAYRAAGEGGTMAGAELHGAVKATFCLRAAIMVEPINVMTARKVFLGASMPRKGARELVHEEIWKLEPPWTLPDGRVPSDEGDALLVANAMRSTLGMPAMVVG